MALYEYNNDMKLGVKATANFIRGEVRSNSSGGGGREEEEM